MPAIATEARVVVETVYRAFPGKAGLFKAVVETAVAGGAERAEVPVERRPAIAAVIEERDPHRQLELYAATQPGIHRRAGPLLRALRAAAALDPELARLWAELEAQRLAGLGQFAELLASRAVLRTDLSAEGARDVIWTLCSLAVHDLLVVERGWPADRYREWLARSLASELLATPLPVPGGEGRA
jgi:TetR/AcrR family transcriptional regulator, regulator of autoinduction and epiphytic fitness